MQDKGHNLRNFLLFLASIGLLTFLFKERERLQEKVNELVANKEDVVDVDPPEAAVAVKEPEPEISTEELFEPAFVAALPNHNEESVDEIIPLSELDEIGDPEVGNNKTDPGSDKDDDNTSNHDQSGNEIEESEYAIDDNELAAFLEQSAAPATKEEPRPFMVPDDPTYSVRSPFADRPHQDVEESTAGLDDEIEHTTPFEDVAPLDSAASENADQGASINGSGADDPSTANPTTNEPTWVRPVDDKCPDGFPIKARFSTGHFHEPGDRGYDKIVPDCCYPSVATAEADGFTPSRWS